MVNPTLKQKTPNELLRQGHVSSPLLVLCVKCARKPLTLDTIKDNTPPPVWLGTHSFAYNLPLLTKQSVTCYTLYTLGRSRLFLLSMRNIFFLAEGCQ